MKYFERHVCPIAVGAFCFLALGGVARAQLPAQVVMEIMPPGTTVCTPQVESGNAYIETLDLAGVLTIAVEASTTPTGPAAVLFTSKKASTQPVIVNPPKPGVYFWRLCGTNARNTAVNTTIWLGGGTIGNVTIPSTLQNGLTAVMPPGAMVCNPVTSDSANRAGSSVQVNTGTPVAVTWFDQDTDSNEDQLPNADVVVAANVNDTVTPQDGGNILGCVQNTSSLTVSVSFNFTGPLYAQ